MSKYEVELGPGGIDAAGVASMLAGMRARQSSALGVYKRLVADREIGRHRLLSYRCARGCLLLDVFESPGGVALYWPTHRRSPSANAETAPAARAARTLDGDRQWIDRAETLEIMRNLTASLNCPHVLDRPVPADEIATRLQSLKALGRSDPHRKVIVGSAVV